MSVDQFASGPCSALKVAIVHDWLVVNGGAEKVLAEMISLFPQADIFSIVCFLPADQRSFLAGKTPTTTFIQRLPGARKRYRSYLPLMPIAIEQLDLSAYDLIISSSYAVAKGVITGPSQLHVSYVHSPIRYAWDLQHSYLQESGLDRGMKGAAARTLLHYIRLWDSRTAHGVDRYIVNSEFVARRVRKAYGRASTVIYPPVDVERFTPGTTKDDFYLTASRMVPYKRIPLIVEAFASMPDRRLIVIGDGPEFEKAKSQATPNVVIMGAQPNEVLQDHMRRARAFLFAAEEDFGILPVEAQASGTPVIAYGRGGALETVRGMNSDRPTGLFFDHPSVEGIRNAVEHFERVEHKFCVAAMRENATRFSREAFRTQFRRVVEEEWTRFQSGISMGSGHSHPDRAA